jgi:DNA-binding response OmpR family regulator
MTERISPVSEHQRVIWVLEADANEQCNYVEILAPHFEVHIFSDIAEFCLALSSKAQGEPPALVIVNLPLFSRLPPETLKDCRDLLREQLITVCSIRDLEHVENCFHLGFGAFLLKPFTRGELLAKIYFLLEVRTDISASALEDNPHTGGIQGWLPICMWCRKIRNSVADWEKLEVYIETRTHAKFTHGICPTCLKEQKARLQKRRAMANK